MTFARHGYPRRLTVAMARRQLNEMRCREIGHDWGDNWSITADNNIKRRCERCGIVHLRRYRPETRETIDRFEFLSRSPAATAAPIPQEGGESTMENIIIDGVEYSLTPVAPRTLTIQRPHVVYDVNGERVDGYKFESRARRQNDARFAGTGYWLGNANTGDFQFVQA